MTPHEITLLFYNIAVLPVVFLSVLFLILVFINLVVRKKEEHAPLAEYPFVTVQVPAYNDPVAARCIEHCLAFDYPADKYEIAICDDSTDISTQNILKAFAEKHANIKYFHRTNRNGFKAGALRDAMPHCKGEIISIFDADWLPPKDFLKIITAPFADPKVAIVQARQGFYNMRTNLITRFASYTLMMYHTIIMPINNRINCVFFCGTAGALRRSAFESVGGWNTTSITEDSDLSVRLLLKGHKSVYLDYEILSEVPETFEGFIKQQMRWVYGNARVFFDNWRSILFRKGLTPWQRLMIMFVTLSNGSSFIVLLMTAAGLSGWFTGTPQLITLSDMTRMLSNFAVTGGFIFAGTFTLAKQRQLREMPHLILSCLSLGLLLAGASAIAFGKASMNRRMHWFCTPKAANTGVFHEHK